MIELLVAMLILAVALTGLAALQLSTIRNVTDAERYSGATRLAEGALARYQTASLTWVQNQAAPNPPDWTIELGRNGKDMRNVGVDGESRGPYTVHRLIEDFPDGRRLVTIRVTWLQTGISTGDAGVGPGAYRVNSVMMTVQRSR